ncbi:MAG TPA: hypothetical protein VGN68_12575 [Sphingopyxis sp.]|jgi:hypothetical protein|uniref:hypothetical protein n=1 Tax=Sphingopyxis sp. TaxID=1908224 RepID=UPI002E146269|nr:hypothetical protein [Sphingopyxis sp.]
MDTIEIAKLLLFSGAASMLFSTFLGFLMLVPMQPWGRQLLQGMNFKQFGAAHLDWLMLGLMQGLAGGLVIVFAVEPAPSAVWAMILGGWLNPLAYVFRAFGVNAFAFGGGATQRLAATLGLGSSVAIAYAWVAILSACWDGWR